MALRLKIVSNHARSLGGRSVKEFGHNGGTIGRSLESDWVLPDGQRFLSSRHASIDFRSGSYYIIDTSTNGVYINGSGQAVGRGKPQRLFAGDRIRIGDYDMLVEIDEADSLQDSPSRPHVDPVDLRQRVDSPDPTTANLIDEFEITGVGIEIVLDEDEAATLAPREYDLEIEGIELEEDRVAPQTVDAASTQALRALTMTEAAPTPNKKTKPERRGGAPSGPQAAERAAKSPTPAQTAPAPASPPAQLESSAAAGVDLLKAFFRGAGIDAPKLDPVQSDQLMHCIGQVMRETLVGLTESLHVRSAQKTLLRTSNTTIQPHGNNSLKFSAGVDEALTHLFRRESEQYLGAVEAVREAFVDIKQHQQFVMKALHVAVSDYIGRLDPDLLEQKFAGRHQRALLGAANKLKYWDMYKDLYQVVAQQEPGELPKIFSDEMGRAYESEAERAGARRTPKLKVGTA
jgi:type VI secretion system protein